MNDDLFILQFDLCRPTRNNWNLIASDYISKVVYNMVSYD